MRKIEKQTVKLPKPLHQVWQYFDQWRQTHPPRTRFSDTLWSKAVAVARKYGHSRTAQVLGLDYYSLKKRLADTPAVCKGNKKKDTPPFIEFFPLANTECIIELEDVKGSKKMRITLKGSDIPELVSLSRSFWNVQA